MSQTATSSTDLRFPCKNCGAKLEFAPGKDSLTCPYCGTLNQIENTAEVAEQDLLNTIQRLEDKQPHETVPVVKCDACAAEVQVPANVTSFTCPFCASNIVAKSRECVVIRPNAVLPFKMTREEATNAYRRWIQKMWWAPGTLKSRSMLEASLSGIYLPHFTFDAEASTAYVGERGDAYYETHWVTANGRRQARQVRKVRWSPASGRVHNSFDDILVPASKTLDQQKVRELTPWDLTECVAYKDDYLAGFRAETYSIPLADAFADAKTRMEQIIDGTIRADIGGDEQRIHDRRTTYSDLMFKHVLLPIWVSAYRYNQKVYQFMVNARTGEVQGQRPYSWLKISAAVIMALLFAAAVIWVLSRS
ncbi:MAG TPA: hypothetical protein VHN77_00590 [Phycisphaerales bacterium]|nr:hypothetical protein [Phycisphaerales bacterium]